MHNHIGKRVFVARPTETFGEDGDEDDDDDDDDDADDAGGGRRIRTCVSECFP